MKTEEEILASGLIAICDRALALSREIKVLEKTLADKKEAYGECFGELCYVISRLEKQGSRHAEPLKLIVGVSDMEIGIAAGKYEAILAYRRAEAQREQKEREEPCGQNCTEEFMMKNISRRLMR